MDHNRLSETFPPYCYSEKPVNSSNNFDLKNSAEERSTQWLDDLATAVACDGKEILAPRKLFGDDRAADVQPELIQGVHSSHSNSFSDMVDWNSRMEPKRPDESFHKLLTRISILEHEFKKCQYPDFHKRSELASTLKLTGIKVDKWFEHRRARQKNLQTIGESSSIESDFHRRQRISLDDFQTAALETSFRKCRVPDYHTVFELSSKLKMSDIQVKNWFKNRRRKQRKEEEAQPPATSKNAALQFYYA